ncbi:RfaJ protein [Canicola haemoglobinophilus]|nr:RfaJ protein [Canicola haemoglobinophilus]STO67872.1 RfaJ protein [Canicola haemoglobinophilus]
MNIVLSCDENYSPYLAVNLLSILKNTKSTINFYILDLGIAFESKSKILEIVNKNNSNIEFIGVDKKDFLKFPSTISHISIATYARLKIDHYLPALDKVIYLDVDTLVINDLTPLWNVDLDGCVVGACIDSYVEFGLQGYKYNIGLTDKDVYFNAGVLLIDLLKFKSLDVYNRAISFLQKYPNIEFQDQDILNFILK